jgi:hypothetical protein
LQPIHLFLDSSIINVVFLWWMFQSFGHEPVNQLVSEIDDDLWHRLGYRSWGHSWRVCWAFLIFSSIPWPSWPLWRKTKKAWPNGDHNSERWPKSVTWIIFPPWFGGVDHWDERNPRKQKGLEGICSCFSGL